ncbi:hypothetical protein ACVME5_000037 [Bradyrhizobium liaoningense]
MPTDGGARGEFEGGPMMLLTLPAEPPAASYRGLRCRQVCSQRSLTRSQFRSDGEMVVNNRCPLRAALAAAMHSSVRIKSAPDPAQMCLHLIADRNCATKSGALLPHGVPALEARHGRVTEALPGPPSMVPARRRKRTSQLRHGSGRSGSPRPGRPRWRSSSPAPKDSVCKIPPKPAEWVRQLRRRVLWCDWSERAGGQSSQPLAGQK